MANQASHEVGRPPAGVVENRLRQLGLQLPSRPVPAGGYVPGKQAGDLIFTSSISAKQGAEVRYPGRLGDTLTLDQGRISARDATLNCLAVIKNIVGSLDKVREVVRVVGYVSSAPGFFEQHLVMNAASELLVELFSEHGQHTRASIGVASLPLNCSVGVELTVQVR